MTKKFNPYGEHCIRRNDGGQDHNRVFLTHPTSDSRYWVEFVLCARSTLLVHGDGVKLLFQRTGPTTLVKEVRMLAVGDDYAVSKCTLGNAVEWDLEIATEDALRALKYELVDKGNDAEDAEKLAHAEWRQLLNGCPDLASANRDV